MKQGEVHPEKAESAIYSRKFYENQRDGSLASARAIVPTILELVPVNSVCDVGCGTGTWLRAFLEAGVPDIFGFDGSYVDLDLLQIPRDKFMPKDLSKRFSVGRKFDLACSLEVAEHLPKSSAEEFITSLTELAPVVVFSAAAPMQGGLGHLNEQWPSYWKNLFAERGYTAIDCLRPRIWDNETVKSWYCQNTFLFATPEAVSRFPKLAEEQRKEPRMPLDVVHPREYLKKANVREFFQDTAKKLPRLFVQALRRKLHFRA